MRAANNNSEVHGEKLVGLFRSSAQFYACDPSLIPEHTHTRFCEMIQIWNKRIIQTQIHEYKHITFTVKAKFWVQIVLSL